MSVDILAFGAHADDVEIGAGGTLLRHIRAGKSAVICDLTYAELSSNGDVQTRQKEAQCSSQILGITERITLGLPDRGIVIDPSSIRSLVQVLRKYKPKVVLAPYWQDRHPDHEHCSHLVREAVFSAAIHKFAPEMGEAHKVRHLFYYFINDFVEPDFCIDVTAVYDEKMNALKCYESQFAAGEGRIQTPLNTGYFEQIRSREYGFGRKLGKGFAEGFKSREPLSLEYFI